MMFKTELSYSGTALAFIKDYVIPNLPSPAASLRAHQNLEDYLRRNSNYIIRKTANHKLRGQWSPSGNGDYKFIISDNEPAVWSYMRTFAGETPNFSDSIQKQSFPIAFALKREERAAADWTKCGRSDRDFSNLGLKHCHIAPCSPRSAPLKTKGDFEKRMLALLSPMNHFLFPGPRRHRMAKDWGEDGKFIELLCYLIANDHYSAEQSAHFKSFLISQGLTLAAQEPADFEISYQSKNIVEPNSIYKYDSEKIAAPESYIDSSDPFYAIEKNTAGTAHDYKTFVEILRNWLEHTDQETVNNECYKFGGKGWLYCKVGDDILRLNQDTRRAGVEAFLKLDHEPEDLTVIPNQRGRVNLVVPTATGAQIPYFYFYLDTAYRDTSGPL